jgi:hypothetical protein
MDSPARAPSGHGRVYCTAGIYRRFDFHSASNSPARVMKNYATLNAARIEHAARFRLGVGRSGDDRLAVENDGPPPVADAAQFSAMRGHRSASGCLVV